MPRPIAYDRKVHNYIRRLEATGHVTRRKYKKKSVTLHHNAGRLSFAQILRVWTTRPASAHFQVDAKGEVGQFVRVQEVAWATGSAKGNAESISVEMANSSLGPNWRVSPVTIEATTRLVAWLFANVIKEAPTKRNLLVHHNWKATVCAGPYIDKNYDAILNRVRVHYNNFMAMKKTTKPKPKSRPLLRNGSRGTAVRDLQTLLNRAGEKLVVDGIFGPATRNAVRRFQRKRKIGIDGIVGPQTWEALTG